MPWRLSLFLLVAVPASAQAPKDSFRLAFDLGFVNASGNTDVTTLNAGEHLSYVSGPWTFAHEVIVIEGRSHGSETAAQYSTDFRVDRALSARFGAYGLAGYYRNPFAGIARRFDEGFGLTAKILSRPHDALSGEVGTSFIQERNTALLENSFSAGRTALLYKHNLTDAATLQETAELLVNFQLTDDRRVNSETSLTAPLSKRISLKAAYLIRFQNLPEPGFKKTDRVLTTGVQVVF
jgi:putative salt-induced outer membrane protein YdiY